MRASLFTWSLVALLSCAACTTDLGRFHVGDAPKQSPGTMAADAGDADDAAASEAGSSDAGDAGAAPMHAGDAGTARTDSGPPDDAGSSDACAQDTLFADDDGDGYGDPSRSMTGCPSEGWVARAGDCADDDRARNPDADELCNDSDDNCDMTVDEGCACSGDDSRACGERGDDAAILTAGECEAGTQRCAGGSWQECEGAVGRQAETCNQLDDDCDDATDEGVALARYTDADGDGFGHAQLPDDCTFGAGVAGQGGDCDDANDHAYPGARERCSDPRASDCDDNDDPICPKTPSLPASCPSLSSGTNTLFGLSTRLWVGARNEDEPGPIVIYFHGTGSQGSEVTLMFPAYKTVTDLGGIVIALNDSTGQGTDFFTGVWFSDDFGVLDQILACALDQLSLDPSRIFVVGTSSGGVTAAYMAYQRSGYVAALLTNSGGFPTATLPALDDPSHVPAVLAAHGKMGSDVVIIDFATASARLLTDIHQHGGFAIDCDHMGGHGAQPTALQTVEWPFLNAHPFAITPEPYAAGLPADFPSYCVTQ
jgi:predicted esterase